MDDFGDVIDLFEDAGVDMRDAYWSHPHSPSDGDKELVIVVDGLRPCHVESVKVEEERIVVVVR